MRLRFFAFLFTCSLLTVAVGVKASTERNSHGTEADPLPGYIYGRVVKIIDGDTLSILNNEEQQIRIRLAEIDTPERGQPYASKSQQELSRLVWEKAVAIRVIDIDRYGRTVGRIFVGDIDVSMEMVNQGAAWVYRKYAKDERMYRAEEAAREAKRGVWSLSEAERIPPWEWRRKSR